MGSLVIPTLIYEDAPKMIDWLCDTFGFTPRAVYPDDKGGVAHAELTLGDGMIMLGSPKDNEFNQVQSTPKALRGVMQSPYLVVEDAQAVFDKVALTGGMIVGELRRDTESGDTFICYDPEGYLWCIGTYNPWQTNAQTQAPAAE
ncbi:VOC family protein [Paradevosia shaoguanensis]|uniref:VOC family protein n=1 Tax=Paradevosia shaoguanensis TaxID=1335043 RepID=A0AA41QJX0_9HYPH|nr:VOC family protein [Paradevosia shaoguanensis]KFL25091.1 hypothetical protein JP74_20860 [Devosia sp. 17-2-E-8]MCF1741788.1 VOC family protein [Paradevosia shaoguanensis]MCI0126271.1 VOC family protein [Paradevosia shaoguanensis]CDP50084.1 FIG00853790: hypothetical protein [Devosia sp. DBB001]